MSPRAIAPNASRALEAAGASQTTRSAGAPTASVPVPAARRNARVLLPVASAIAISGARSPSEASSQMVLITPIGMTPVPVGVSLARHSAVSVWMVKGTSADGEALNYQGCDIYEFRGDKILNKDTYWKIVE